MMISGRTLWKKIDVCIYIYNIYSDICIPSMLRIHTKICEVK